MSMLAIRTVGHLATLSGGHLVELTAPRLDDSLVFHLATCLVQMKETRLVLPMVVVMVS